MYMTDTFCSFTRNFIFKSCFLLSELGSVWKGRELSLSALPYTFLATVGPIINPNVNLYFIDCITSH